MQAADELGRYRILESIGRGSTGTVYRARDTLIGREVAIKCVQGASAGSGRSAGELRDELLREARSAGMLSHPNVVTVYDVLELPGDSLYIAMEYVHGRSLGDLLAGGRPLELERVVDLVAQVASALDYLHAMGVVHRDVKPGNVLLTDAGRVKLTDFGIAFSAWEGGRESAGGSEEGEVLGTPEYMAPEQILGRPITLRTDVWALGVVVHEMLTGERPFRGDSVAEIVHRVVHGQRSAKDAEALPEPADELRALLDRALARDPEQRFASAGELAAELRRILYRPGAGAGEATLAGGSEMLDQTLVAPRPPSEPAGPKRPAGTRPGAPAAFRSLIDRWLPRRYRPAALLAAVGCGLLLAAVLVDGSLDGPPAGGLPAPGSEVQGLDGGSLETLQLLRHGQRLSAQGDADGAALFFEVVERLEPLVPESGRIARLRREAEAEAARQGADLAGARSALGDRASGELVASAREHLGTAGGEAAETLSALDRAGHSLSPSDRPDPAAAADSGRPRVTVEFWSEAPEGAVMIYGGGEQLLRRGFSYYEREWLLNRTPKSGGFHADLELPPGVDVLWIYVARAEGPARHLEIDARLPRGAHRVLRVHLPAEGQATAEWEE
ncbi:MAG: serine/threonine-protein kinase [Thermoanaerobaculia bacterium]